MMGVPDWKGRNDGCPGLEPRIGAETMGVPDWVLGFMGVPDWVIFQFMADHEFNNPAT